MENDIESIAKEMGEEVMRVWTDTGVSAYMSTGLPIMELPTWLHKYYQGRWESYKTQGVREGQRG